MDQLRGQDLKQAFSAATGCLEEYRDAVNALNVFPVPDGDTGTNMLLTMRSAVQSVADECSDSQDHSVATVSSFLAQGSFYGAKGNSGVILSQFFKGFSDALAGKKFLAPDDLALAFRLASDACYKAVGDPVEGTMLTVIRMASEAMQGAVQGPKRNVLGLWETAYLASQDALSRTPSQLPVLREAGVVDAGGMGIVVLIGGVLRSLSNSNPSGGASPSVDLAALSRFHQATDNGLIKPGYLNATLEKEWGYCTQFIISGQDLDLDGLRNHFKETALSTVVVGDGQSVRVHIHVMDTAAALSYAAAQGAVSEIKIDDMDSQNRTFATGASGGHMELPESAAVALLPVTQGAGLAHLFLELGCAAVIEGGQTMNPSVGQILDVARGTGAKDVIILSNNGNVILAAEQAAAAESFIHVVPTNCVPQGVAALLAYNPEGTWQENIDSMTAALSEVASVTVTKAARSVNIGGVAAAEGQYIGLLDGQLVSAEESPEMALRAALDRAGLSSGAVVTLYHGEGASLSEARSVAEALESSFPGIQVDLIDGGQPHYQYLASVE